MPRRTKAAVWCLMGILMMAGGYCVFEQQCLHHFRTVKAEVLYRSGQPRSLGLEYVRLRGIRTLVNLRAPLSDGTPEERRFAEEHGLKFYNIHIGTCPASIDRSVQAFLDIVEDRENWPVLVHCSRGKERAGVLSAVFRMEHDGWSNALALEELYALGLEPGSMPVVETYLRDYVPGKNAPTGYIEQVGLPEVPWQE